MLGDVWVLGTKQEIQLIVNKGHSEAHIWGRKPQTEEEANPQTPEDAVVI